MYQINKISNFRFYHCASVHINDFQHTCYVSAISSTAFFSSFFSLKFAEPVLILIYSFISIAFKNRMAIHNTVSHFSTWRNLRRRSKPGHKHRGPCSLVYPRTISIRTRLRRTDWPGQATNDVDWPKVWVVPGSYEVVNVVASLQ